ncbi:MAG: DUF3568 family protein [Planctomycetes bacterium]|nr:DUF3568 family protein [Planctomycetota bacterium]
MRLFLATSCLSIAGVAALSGCVTPFDFAANAGLGVAQAGTSSFIQGTLQAAFDRPMDEVVDAARRTLVKLGYAITREDIGPHYAQLLSSQADGSSIVVKFKKSSDTVTGLSIRVGFWGDNAVSRLMLEGIQKELGVKPGAIDAPVPAHAAPAEGT